MSCTSKLSNKNSVKDTKTNLIVLINKYIYKEWIDDRQRCREAGIPETVGFQTKCELARQMVERIYKAQIPISWVVADTVYGNNLDLRTWLSDHGYFHVSNVRPAALAGPSNLPKIGLIFHHISCPKACISRIRRVSIASILKHAIV